MGLVIDVRSRSLLLQREEHEAAREALASLARDRPGELEVPDAVLAAPTLATALEATFLAATLDEHGDLVALATAADKAPRDSAPDWPASILGALAPFVAYGDFVRHTEGDPGICWLSIHDDEVFEQRVERGVDLVPRAIPELRAGEAATVEFLVDGRGALEGAIRIDPWTATQCEVVVETATVKIGEVGRVRVTLHDGAADPVAIRLGIEDVDGAWDQVARLDVRVAHPHDGDGVHEVVATVSAYDRGQVVRVVPARHVERVHAIVRRHAARRRDRAACFAAAAEAPDLVGALRAVGLDTGLDEGGALLDLRFRGDRLPAAERDLAEMIWAMRGFVRHAPWVHLAYAHAPRRWVALSTANHEPRRELLPRTP